MPDNNKRRRNLRYGSSTVVSTLLILGILVFIALISERHPWRVDLTESGTFTLSQQARNILKSLNQPIEIKAFFATSAPEQAKAKDLLDTYHYYSNKVTYEFIDPDRHPDVAKRYGVRTYGTLVIEGYGKKQVIQTASEEALTNAIHKLMSKETKTIYFLTGHGERAMDSMGKDGYSSAKTALEKEDYKLATLNLMEQPQVPKDAALVVVAGPRKPLFSQEIDSLKSYLTDGGRVMLLIDPFHDGGLRDFVSSYGMKLSDDEVIDKLSRVFGGSYLMPVVMDYGPHQITESFNVATFYPDARSVRIEKNVPKNIHPEVLASTSANSWAETNLKLLKDGKADFDKDQDKQGPVPLIAISEIDSANPAPKPPPRADAKPAAEAGEKATPAAQKSDEKPSAKSYLLVAGNSSFADNTYFELSGNGDFFLNMVSFLAQDHNLITIDHRNKAPRLLMLSQGQANWMFWLVLVLVPLMALVSGFFVYRVRRLQR
jgi:ABC-type uncharacterized transport system involved in gliding motility auxiliary subunit